MARQAFGRPELRTALEARRAAGESPACTAPSRLVQSTPRKRAPPRARVLRRRVSTRKEDGTTTFADRKAGEVAWFEGGWHAAQNIGPEGARICMVELKDKSWRPSTGASL